MSSLVDIWTSEFAKLKEKAIGAPTGGRDARSGGAVASAAYSGLSEALRIKPRPPVALCSDAALAMMERCSP